MICIMNGYCLDHKPTPRTQNNHGGAWQEPGKDCFYIALTSFGERNAVEPKWYCSPYNYRTYKTVKENLQKLMYYDEKEHQ